MKLNILSWKKGKQTFALTIVLHKQVSNFCECKTIISATYGGLALNVNNQIGEKCTYKRYKLDCKMTLSSSLCKKPNFAKNVTYDCLALTPRYYDNVPTFSVTPCIWN